MPPKSPPPRPAPAAPSGGKNIDSVIVDVIVAIVILFLIVGFLGSFFTSVAGSYVNVIAWLYGPNLRILYIAATIIIGLLDACLLCLAVFILKRYNKLHAEVPPEEVMSRMISPEQEFQQNWQDIQGLIRSEDSSDWNMAMLRADAQLDEVQPVFSARLPAGDDLQIGFARFLVPVEPFFERFSLPAGLLQLESVQLDLGRLF